MPISQSILILEKFLKGVLVCVKVFTTPVKKPCAPGTADCRFPEEGADPAVHFADGFTSLLAGFVKIVVVIGITAVVFRNDKFQF